jgi:2-polyprenyl-3-methyl-5-hydroxy-6-metoxy-1,4-benzoquinol methylase
MNACPWCKSENARSYIKLQDYFLTNDAFEVMECQSCHLLFTTPRPTPDKIDAYYQSEKYYSHQENKNGFIPHIYEAVKTVNLKNKLRMATHGIENGKILDIGCGVGDFLFKAKQSGWKVTGIEPSPNASKIASHKLQSQILLPSQISSLEDESFNLITMWHVLEHVDDLNAQIKELHRLLKPNGRLVLALPNFMSYDADYYKDKWAAWDVPRHLNHFCRSSMDSVFSSSWKKENVEKLLWDSYYISFLSEQYEGHSLALLRGVFRGFVSNWKAKKTGEYSSLVYFYRK